MLSIITNNAPRNLVSGYEIQAQREGFDYLSDEEFESRDFVIFKGRTYDVGEFMTCYNSPFPDEWQGYMSDSFFSGVLIRYVNDCDQAVMATYYS